jgi:hypothetical protein
MIFRSVLLIMFLLLAGSLFYAGSGSGQANEPESLPNDSFRTISELYKTINDSDIDFTAFQLAMQGYRLLKTKGLVKKDSILTLIDYSRPSSDVRFYVIDLLSGNLVFKTLVAHGRNSGELYAKQFSNRKQSHQTALGFYITGNPYQGGQGYSMTLNGVDTGFNENARARAIVIHGADYVTRQYINHYGRLGRSFGCPALPPEMNDTIINVIKEGSVLFCYYPDPDYLIHSPILSNLFKRSANDFLPDHYDPI